ncbi:guanine nucleotide exchange protein for ADP-robosylation factor [Coemansia sp. RSA 2598]|nr:guanine nucleotide exchange protein for ADP-robosylation factor [Coemansia sp. RSA 2598]
MKETVPDALQSNAPASPDESPAESPPVSPAISEYSDSRQHAEPDEAATESPQTAKDSPGDSSRQSLSPAKQQSTERSSDSAHFESTAQSPSANGISNGSDTGDQAAASADNQEAETAGDQAHNAGSVGAADEEEDAPMPASPAVSGLPGLVFITGAVEKLLGTREAKKRDVRAALEKMQQVLAPKAQQNTWLGREDIEMVIDAFDLLCVTQSSANTLVIALDCIEKLVSFHYFDNVTNLTTVSAVLRRIRSNRQGADGLDDQEALREAEMETQAIHLAYFRGIAERLVGMVARCYQGDGTSDTVQLQIVKALFALISSDKLPVRQSAMLNTIRTAYNVFVLSKSQGNQTIAQGTLTQMVRLVLSRVPVEIDDADEEGVGAEEIKKRSMNDGAARDAFLLLRALCKLSMRQIPNDHMVDGKSPLLRSRCLALNLIRLALAEHTAVFVSSYVYLRSVSHDAKGPGAVSAGHGANGMVGDKDDDEFGDTEGPDQVISQEIAQTASRQLEQDAAGRNGESSAAHRDAGDSLEAASDGDGGSSAQPPSAVAVPLVAVIRQHLSLSLSRNLVSSNPMVLDLGLAVFELTMLNARMYLRHEMEVIFREILLPLLESKSSGSLHQRGRLLQTLGRLLAQPALVVELYLNYDCAENSQVNVFQRLAEILCKLGGNYIPPPSKSSPHYWLASPNAESSAEGAATLMAAWRAVQQRQTVFNVPLSQTLQASAPTATSGSSSSNSGGSLDVPFNGAAADLRRGSGSFSMANQSSTIGSFSGVSGATLTYGGINFATSDKSNVASAAAAASTDEYMVRQWAMDGLATMLQSMVVWSDRLADSSGSSRAPTSAVDAAVDVDDSAAKAAADAAAAAAAAEQVKAAGGGEPDNSSSAAANDDPEELSSIKYRKQQYELGCKLFAWKPKKGIEAWRSAGFIKSNDPQELARFFTVHNDQGIDKLQLGEYLGEGDAYNIAVMHAFVDQMDFVGSDFVAALRQFLQKFRLPGEGQKIDRFMLKFAERYVIGNPNTGFANADTVYVLAYSTIMLNTDHYSPQVKKRMTKQEFINNNKGINEGQDLDVALLSDIFDQIDKEEIKMTDDPLQSKVQGAASAGAGSLFVLWGNSTANRIREQHAHASAEMAAKSEQSIRSMARMRRRRAVRKPSVSIAADMLNGDAGTNGGEQGDDAGSLATLDTWAMLLDMSDYLHATRSDHIAPMFGIIWAAVLAALSSPMQTSSDPHVIAACLIGFQCGIALSCRFRMPLERATFVTTLRNFTQLQNLAEMKRKHVEAIRALIEVAASRPDVGDGLAENWLDVLQCVSQLERLQLLTQGSEAAATASLHRTSRVSSSGDGGSMFGFATGVLTGGSGGAGSQSVSARALFTSPAAGSAVGAAAGSSLDSLSLSLSSSSVTSNTQVPKVSVAELAKLETNSQVLVVMVDRLFTSSVHLSGSGIVDFVRALSRVAWGEITSTFRGEELKQQQQQQRQSGYQRNHRRQLSAVTRNPPSALSRLFSMTKIVEISYYNMGRIRVEWSQIWAILGPLFDRVGAYSDTRAALFALDSLRQLSMKFLEKEELPHFAFQKEFLRPFADILEGYIPPASAAIDGDGSVGLAHGRPMANVAVDVLVKDMVLRCVHQIVQAASFHIRSGWKAILNVAQIAARDSSDGIAEMGFHIAKTCAEQHGSQMWTLVTSTVPVAGDDEAKTVDIVSVSGLEYFHELIDCLNEFAVGAAVQRPRFALGAIDTMYFAAASLGKQIRKHADYSAAKCEGVSLDDQPLYRVWMPVLRAQHEVVMHTEDLEVRTRALDSFFKLIMSQGQHFSQGLWASVLRDLVFTMFADLRDPSASRRFATVDDLELWFSTTLIKALRHLVSLFTRYYPKQLSNAMMAEVLELLVMCIAQPSEVLGKIGTSCLQDLIRSNYAKWDEEAWGMVCDTLARLFNWSQPRELFSIAGASWESEQRATAAAAGAGAAGGGGGEGEVLPVLPPKLRKVPSANNARAYAANRPSPLRTGGSAASLLSSTDGNETPSPASAGTENNVPPAPLPVPTMKPLPRAGSSRSLSVASSEAETKPDYIHITLKCIQQLLLIQTLGELFGANVETGELLPESEDFYAHMSAHHLFILLDCLDQSRAFAHRFNKDRKVRRRLVEMGVMPTMPSLLKQETSSVLTELHILQRMHFDAIGISENTSGRSNGHGAAAATAATAAGRKQISGSVLAERQAVGDEVDDRLASLMRGVLSQYCSALAETDMASMSEEVRVRSTGNGGQRPVCVVSSRVVQGTSEADVKRRMVVTTAWRSSVLTVLAHVAQLVDSGDESRPFRASVERLWPELVNCLGVAAGVGDLDVVGALQRILAYVGSEFAVSVSKCVVRE